MRSPGQLQLWIPSLCLSPSSNANYCTQDLVEDENRADKGEKAIRPSKMATTVMGSNVLSCVFVSTSARAAADEVAGAVGEDETR